MSVHYQQFLLGISSEILASVIGSSSAVGTAVKNSCRQGMPNSFSAQAINRFKSDLSILPIGFFQMSALYE